MGLPPQNLHWSRKKKGKGFTKAKKRDAIVAEALVETKLRSAALDVYMNMIPARFLLGTENEQLHAANPGFDPTEAKSTTQIVAEAAEADAAVEAEAKVAMGMQPKTTAQKRRELRRGKAPEAGKAGTASAVDPKSREELKEKLRLRLEELKTERKQSQSVRDKDVAAEKAKAKAASGEVDQEAFRAAKAKKAEKAAERAAKSATPVKAKAEKAGKAAEEESLKAKEPRDEAKPGAKPEVGRLTFDMKTSDLPWGVEVGRGGSKAKRLRDAMAKTEKEAAKLDQAEAEGRGDEFRKETAMQKALMRARGEAVHDDATRMRKAQSRMQMSKKKTKMKWDDRKVEAKRMMEEKQATRKENLAKPRTKKQKASAERKQIMEDAELAT